MEQPKLITITLTIALIFISVITFASFQGRFNNNQNSVKGTKSLETSIPTAFSSIPIINAKNQNDAGSGGDAGDTFGTALFITPGDYTGELPLGDIYDFYQFAVNTSELIDITITGDSGTDFDIYLYNPTETMRDYSEHTSYPDTISFAADMIGNWRLEVAKYSGDGDYSFQLALSPQATTPTDPNSSDDANSGGDAGDTFDTALFITPGDYTGELPLGDIYDFYQFTVDINELIEISITGDSGTDFDIYLHDPMEYVRDYSDYVSYPDTISFVADMIGNWRLEVEKYSGDGSYSFQLTLSPHATTPATTPTDPGSSDDAGDSFNDATRISEGTYTGALIEGDTDDYYEFYVDSGYQVAITLSGDYGTDFDLYLYDPSQTVMETSTGGESSEEIDYITDSAGYWVIRIFKYSSESGSYSFTLSISEAPYTTSETSSGFNLNLVWIIVGIVIGFIVLVFIGVGAVTISRRKRQDRLQQTTTDPESMFRLAPLETTTDSSTQEISQIGYSFDKQSREVERPALFLGDPTDKICMICKLQFDSGESILQCPNCISLFHENHLNQWLMESDTCPVCGQKLRE